MLSLAPPLYVINGVSLMRDSEDEEQYYYAPIEPRLALRRNPLTGAEVPVLKLFKFTSPDGDRAGILVFDTTLGLRPDEQADIVAELESLAGLRRPPRLSPLPLTGGTVRLIMLGREPGVPSAQPVTPATTADDFVAAVSHSVSPALYGDNRAIFSVALKPDGVAIVEAAMRGDIMPLGVIYDLEFLALRPAFRFTIDADWERVQDHFEQTVGSSSMLHEVKVSEIVDSLVEAQVIKIDVATFVPDDEDDAAVIDQRDELLDELKGMILEKFFVPSLDPITQKTDGWDQTAHGISSLRKAFHSGGADGLFTFRRQKVERTDERTFKADVTSSTTIRRSIHPQAHLQGLSGLVGVLGLDIDDFIEAVTPDPFFEKRTVEVSALADFAADGISRITVRVRYGSEQHDVALTATGQTGTVVFDSIVERGVVRRAVEVDFTVSFTGADTSERPAQLQSAPRTYTTDHVEVIARDLYTVTPIPIRFLPAGLLTEFPQIEVQLRYADKTHAIAQDDVVRLDEQAPAATWRQFQMDPELTGFDYRIRYHGGGLSDRQTDWRRADSEEVVVRHPAANRVPVTVVAPGVFDGLRFVFVDLFYRDPDTALVTEYNVQFDKDNRGLRQVAVETAANHPFLLSYRVTLLREDGDLIEIPESMTRQRRVIVQLEPTAHRVVEVRPDGTPFAATELRELIADLSYEGGDGKFHRLFAFPAHDAPAEFFEYDFPDGETGEYQIVVERRFQNGLSVRSAPVRTDRRQFIVPAQS
ncbi:hypothetical protein KOI35_30790 [Actinoplanes bogorensis]|uniref:Uncharacterized protein n=1 Tax=Paractinoplanes bogorensis TaxID=1610840 RepID=A0ABS5YWT3_9ACTN|nr:hypothetical protein [Actinoplanes bogorensis]MBU2667907.1 hypothetical protein [Actinoplanes bogorensis]